MLSCPQLDCGLGCHPILWSSRQSLSSSDNRVTLTWRKGS